MLPRILWRERAKKECTSRIYKSSSRPSVELWAENVCYRNWGTDWIQVRTVFGVVRPQFIWAYQQVTHVTWCRSGNVLCQKYGQCRWPYQWSDGQRKSAEERKMSKSDHREAERKNIASDKIDNDVSEEEESERWVELLKMFAISKQSSTSDM